MLYPQKDGFVSRSPRSGGWAGEKVLSGDLIPIYNDRIDYRFPFFFEVKRVKRSTVSPIRLMMGDPGVLRVWLAKAEKQALLNYCPLILWKVDFSSWFVFMSEMSFESLLESFGPLHRPYTFLRISSSVVVEDLPNGYFNMRLEDFSAWFKSEVFTAEKEK